MTRFGLLLLLGCVLVPASLAQEGAIAEPGAEQGQPVQLANELDQFVRDAIDEGLLTPVGEADAEPEEQADDRPSLPAGVRPRQAAPFEVEVDCNGPNPLDFGEFEAFDRYQQIYTFQEKASQQPGQGEELAGVELAKAYLALGLYSEAGMVLKSTPGPVATASQEQHSKARARKVKARERVAR